MEQFYSSEENPVVLLNDYIRYAIDKYKKTESVMYYLAKYCDLYYASSPEDGLNYITRDKDLRNRFRNNLTPILIRKIVNNNLEFYVRNICYKDRPQTLIREYIAYLIIKGYSNDDIITSINSFMNGNLNAILKDNNFQYFFKFYIDIFSYNRFIQYGDLATKIANIRSQINQSSSKQVSSNKENPVALLNEYIVISMNKYHSVKTVVQYLEKYCKLFDLNNIDGALNCITRDNDLRKRFRINLSSSLVRQITNNNLEVYVKFTVYKQNPHILLQDYITYLINEGYSDDFITSSINSFMTGNQNAISSNGNYRYFFAAFIDRGFIQLESLDKEIANIRSQISKSSISNNSQPIVFNHNEGLFKEYVQYALNKLGIQGTFDSINEFLKGSKNAILPDNNYKSLFETYISPYIVNDICKGNLMGYINKIYYEEKSQSLNQSQSSNNQNFDVNIVLNAFLETYKKYGLNQLKTAIDKGVDGDYRFFTNGGNMRYRDYLSQLDATTFQKACATIVISSGYSGGSIDVIKKQLLDIVQASNIELQNKKAY